MNPNRGGGRELFRETRATSSFAVDDLERAREFYGEKLGLEIEELDRENGVLMLKLAGGRDTLMYLSGDMTPPSYTILNFEVPDIDAALARLVACGIAPERYDDIDQDENGVVRGPGPQIAWFKDPAGNVLAVLQRG